LDAWTRHRPKYLHEIDWVIAGGESGSNARAMMPGWARQLRDECQQSGIPFHFKQWGHWTPVAAPQNEKSTVRKFWDEVLGMEIFMEAKGKKVSGRRLDGTTWDELPATA
jgi:protein gp37